MSNANSKSQPGPHPGSFTPQTESSHHPTPVLVPQAGGAPCHQTPEHVPPHFRYDPDQDAYDVNLNQVSSADYDALEAKFYRLAPAPTSTSPTNTATSSSSSTAPSPTSALSQPVAQLPTNTQAPAGQWNMYQQPLGSLSMTAGGGAQGPNSGPQTIVVQPLVYVVGSEGNSVPMNQSAQPQLLPPPYPPYGTASGASPSQPQVALPFAPPGRHNTTQFAPPAVPPVPLGAEAPPQQQQPPAETTPSETKEPTRRVSPVVSPRRVFIGQVPVTRTDDGGIATDRIATQRMLLLLCQYVKHKFCPFEGDVWFADPLYEGTGCVRPQVASQVVYPLTHVLPCRVIVSQDFNADREMTIFQEPLTDEAVRRLRDSRTHLVIVFQDQHTISERQQLRSNAGKKGNWANKKKNPGGV